MPFLNASSSSTHSNIYYLGFNVKTGEVFHATFPDKGPEIPLRSARQLTGSSHVFPYVL